MTGGVESSVTPNVVDAVLVPNADWMTSWLRELALSGTDKLNAPDPLAVVVAVLAPPVTVMFALASALPLMVRGEEVPQNCPRVIVGVMMVIGVVVATVVVDTAETMTKRVVVAVLPASSTAVQVTVVVPTAKRPPEAGTQVTVVVAERLSVTSGKAKLTIAPAEVDAVAVTSVVDAKTGSVLSYRIEIMVDELVLPMPSSAKIERLLRALGLRPTDALQLPEPSTVAVEVAEPPVRVMVLPMVPVPLTVTGDELATTG